MHGTTLAKIHFHEVGALDSIADIVGCCVGLELLGIQGVTFGPLPQGRGTITCQHGVYPNPPPATMLLLTGLPVVQTEEPHELVTPTGAALLATWRTMDRPPAGSRIERVGYGFGHRKLDARTNVLRATILVTDDGAREDDVVTVLETNLDDSMPEIVGALSDRLLAEGALDVFTTPVLMKKQRPASLLTVLCRPADRGRLLDLIFAESTTFGVREHEARRTILDRAFSTVQTPYGPIRIKEGRRNGQLVTRSPELEDCRRAASEHQVAVREVYAAASAACRT